MTRPLKFLIASLILSFACPSYGQDALIRQQRHYDDIRHHIHNQDRRYHHHRYKHVLRDKKPSIVPQLLANYTGIPLPPPEEVSCADAQVQCAYRAGCGLALQNYVLGCSDLVHGKTQKCNRHCRHSLISLTSTPEGRRLMKCNCSDDEFCIQSKSRISVCEEQVLYATRSDTIVTCSAAQWICSSDPGCATALDYYHLFCGAMFKGKRCTDRCLNSISILRRQQAAAKLETCFCDGSEDYDCPSIKDNMQRLCFRKDEESNEIPGDDDESSSSSKLLQTLNLFLILFGLMVNMVMNMFMTKDDENAT